MGISSNIMKSPSPKWYMTFWDMTIYNDTLNWSDITPICELITELDFNTEFELITEFEGFHRTLQRMRLANRGRLLLRTPCPVPFGTCICSYVENILSWTCHIYGPFEFQTSLGTSILLTNEMSNCSKALWDFSIQFRVSRRKTPDIRIIFNLRVVISSNEFFKKKKTEQLWSKVWYFID